MKSASDLNFKNQLDDEDLDLENPTTPVVKRNRDEMMDFSFGSTLLSQNDVGWGSPIDNFAQEYEERKKKRKLVNRPAITTPVRVMKRCASSPALGDSNGRSDPSKNRPEECKNLNDIFEDSEIMENSSQEINFGWDLEIEPARKPEVVDINNTSIDDILLTLPIEEIAKATRKGANNVDIRFDPQVGSSQVVRNEPCDIKPAPSKNFVRHNSLPLSSSGKSPEEENGHKQRRCTPEEIAAKKQAALEKLLKNRGNVLAQKVQSSQQQQQISRNARTKNFDFPKPMPSTSISNNVTTNGNHKQCSKEEIEAKRLKALELLKLKKANMYRKLPNN